jgi:hypothetical protein
VESPRVTKVVRSVPCRLQWLGMASIPSAIDRVDLYFPHISPTASFSERAAVRGRPEGESRSQVKTRRTRANTKAWLGPVWSRRVRRNLGIPVNCAKMLEENRLRAECLAVILDRVTFYILSSAGFFRHCPGAADHGQ